MNISSKTIKIIVTLVLLPFSALTAITIWQHGFMGIFAVQLSTWAGIQVFIDLVIATIIILVWMWFDSRKTKSLYWPWVIVALIAGSFGPLLYLLFRKDANKE